MSGKKLFLLGIVLLICHRLSAEPGEAHIPYLQQAITIDDFSTMNPREELRRQMGHVEGFVQSNPRNGEASSQKTEVYLWYNDTHFFTVFLCFDREPSQVRASLTRRENISDEEDWVEMYLDTYNDQRRAYLFSTNALGIQWDARFSEEEGFQPSYDALWDSEGRLTDQGYVVWMAIPFKTMRFKSAPSQQWRVLFGRSIPRSNEYAAWPHISKEIKGTLNQTSVLTGLENISPGKNLQFIPYTSYRGFRVLDTNGDQPHFIRDLADASVGLDSKIVIRDNSVLDLTLNPDFSQVESDEPQVTVNQRFEVFFPEKRPFFLENAQYFETPLDLVFTRRIADPQFGVRLTGKYGPYTLAVLTANDEAPGKIVPEIDPVSGKDAYFGIFRFSRDIFQQSSIGALFTARQFDNESNMVGGVDSRLRLGENWAARIQAVASSTDFLDGPSISGPAYSANLSRAGLSFNCELTYEDIAEDFRTLTGFVNRTDVQTVDGNVRYIFHPQDSIFLGWGPEFFATNVWDHSGTHLDVIYHPMLSFEFPGKTYLNFHYFWREERLRPEDFPGLTENVNFEEPAWQINFNTGYWKWMTLFSRYTRGKSVNFVPAENQLPESANSQSAYVQANLRPIRPLQIENSYLYTALSDPDTQSVIFNDHIIRTKWNWQLSRRLSLRTIVEYDATIPNAEFTALESTKNVNFDFLVIYLVNPWTAFYAGYNGNHQNIVLQEDLVVRGDDWLNDANQFFLKFSYLFQF